MCRTNHPGCSTAHSLPFVLSEILTATTMAPEPFSCVQPRGTGTAPRGLETMRPIEARGFRGVLRAAATLLVCVVLLDVAARVADAQTPFGFPHVVEKARTLSS